VALVSPIVLPFPEPPGSVLKALELLAVLRRNDPDEIAEAGDLADLPRPWEPAKCPQDLREAVWEWCDRVVTWLNHEFAWRPTQMIPLCWPLHAHVAREIPVLAVLRWFAEESTTPDQLEEWHRYAYPMFCDRMISRLGESGCRTGSHIDWPAEARFDAHTKTSQQRQSVIYADTRPVS
jgi:hypothetical protein